MISQVPRTGSIQLVANDITDTGQYNFTWSDTGANQISNAYSNSTNSSTWGRLTPSYSSRRERTSTAYIEFDKSLLNNIPSNASAFSITCNIAYRISSTSTVSSLSLRLYTNTTAKGSARTSRPTSKSTYSITPGTWNRNELNNIRLYVSVTRSTSGNSSSGYLDIYGIELIINYSYTTNVYEINTSTVSPSTITFNPTSLEIDEGEDGSITINNITDLTTTSITDNGNNIINDLIHISGPSYRYDLTNVQEDHTLIARQVTAYNITVQNTSTNVTGTVPTSGSTIRTAEGSDYTIEILTVYPERINVSDNDNNVNNQLIIQQQQLELNSTSNLNHYIESSGWYNQTDMSDAWNDSSNTETYGRLGLRNTNNAYYVYGFDTLDIPDNAIDISVTCKVRAYVTSTSSSITVKRVQLYSGTTAKGNSYTLPTTNQVITLNTGTSWSINEFNDLRLRFEGSYSGSSNYYIRIYGADITVTYSIEGKVYYTVSNVQAAHTIRIEDKPTYNITTSSSVTGTTIAPASSTVFEGANVILTITTDDKIEHLIVKDNNIDVTSSVVSSSSNTSSATFIPSEVDNINSIYDSVYNNYVLSNGLTDENSNTRASVCALSDANAVSKMVYKFNCSSIPQNAVITSVTCRAGAARYWNGQDFSSNTLQLYTGLIAKGTATNVTGNESNKAYHNIDGGTTWTRAELDNINIVIQAVRTESEPESLRTINFSFWGATLTVNYYIPSYTYTITNVQSDHTVTITPKTNHTITTDSSLSGSILTPDDPKIYSGESIVFTIVTDNIYAVCLKLDNVDVTSGITNSTYTITDNGNDRILTILEASYHTLTTNSSLSGVTVSPSGSNNKIYSGGFIDVTINGLTNQNSAKILLNGLDITADVDIIIDTENNIYSSRYRVQDNGNNQTFTVVEQDKFTISGTGYNGVTVSISDTPVYLGDSSTITLNNVTDIDEITVYDNGRAITGRFTQSGSSYTYTLNSITTNHTITIGPHVTYTITSTNNTETPITIVPTGNRTVDAGDSFTIGVMTNDVSHVKVLDNSVDTSSELVYVAAQNNQTISSNPNEVVEAPDGFVSGYPATNAFYPSNNTQRHARINVPLGSTIYAIFNLTPIELPEFAIINSVSCIVRAYVPYSYSINPRTVQLYSGTTAKGSATTLRTSSGTSNLDCGTWTVNELKDIKLRFDATETDDTASHIRFYGATFTVNYTIPEHYEYILEDISAAHTVVFSEVFVTVFSRASNSWTENSKIYEKRNGNWVQVEGDDILTLFDTHKIYIRK